MAMPITRDNPPQTKQLADPYMLKEGTEPKTETVVWRHFMLPILLL